MPIPLRVPLPPNLDLWDSCVIRVTAINATTGATVSGVDVGEVTLEVTQTSGNPIDTLGVGQLLVKQAQGPGTNV